MDSFVSGRSALTSLVILPRWQFMQFDKSNTLPTRAKEGFVHNILIVSYCAKNLSWEFMKR